MGGRWGVKSRSLCFMEYVRFIPVSASHVLQTSKSKQVARLQTESTTQYPKDVMLRESLNKAHNRKRRPRPEMTLNQWADVTPQAVPKL